MGASGIPSECAALLTSLVGRTIVGATRYSWYSAAEAQRRCAAPARAVFSLTRGPLALEFDSGLILGIANDPSLRSIRVWVERNELGRAVAAKPCASDGDLHPIDATDPILSDALWRNIIGAKVSAISTLIHKPATAKEQALPNEAGLCFDLDTGVRIVAGHGLHDGSADFAIIPEEWIANDIRPQLSKGRLPLSAPG